MCIVTNSKKIYSKQYTYVCLTSCTALIDDMYMLDSQGLLRIRQCSAEITSASVTLL